MSDSRGFITESAVLVSYPPTNEYNVILVIRNFHHHFISVEALNTSRSRLNCGTGRRRLMVCLPQRAEEQEYYVYYEYSYIAKKKFKKKKKKRERERERERDREPALTGQAEVARPPTHAAFESFT
jgi:hypothetical protein